MEYLNCFEMDYSNLPFNVFSDERRDGLHFSLFKFYWAGPLGSLIYKPVKEILKVIIYDLLKPIKYNKKICGQKTKIPKNPLSFSFLI